MIELVEISSLPCLNHQSVGRSVRQLIDWLFSYGTVRDRKASCPRKGEMQTDWITKPKIKQTKTICYCCYSCYCCCYYSCCCCCRGPKKLFIKPQTKWTLPKMKVKLILFWYFFAAAAAGGFSSVAAWLLGLAWPFFGDDVNIISPPTQRAPIRPPVSSLSLFLSRCAWPLACAMARFNLRRARVYVTSKRGIIIIVDHKLSSSWALSAFVSSVFRSVFSLWQEASICMGQRHLHLQLSRTKKCERYNLHA